MNRLASHLIVAASFFIIGWFVSREYLLSQMAAAFLAPSAPTRALLDIGHVIDSPEKPSAVLSNIQISEPRIDTTRSSIEPLLVVHLKNSSDKTLSMISIAYALQSPDRKVPWMTEDHLSVGIDGGLAPGEERDERFYGLGNASLVRNLKEHPDAKLSVRVVHAWDEAKNSL